MNTFEIITALAILIAHVRAGYLSGGFDGYSGLDSYGGGHDEYAHPKYSFNYAVHDPHTGDEKQHSEHRDGHTVKGTYSLKEADGTTRIVEYKADKHSGFNAVVHKIGHPIHHSSGHSFGGSYAGGYLHHY